MTRTPDMTSHTHTHTHTQTKITATNSRMMLSVHEVELTLSASQGHVGGAEVQVHSFITDGDENSVSNGINPYPTAFPYGNGMVLHFYQQQESSTTKTVHKVINKGLKTYV